MQIILHHIFIANLYKHKSIMKFFKIALALLLCPMVSQAQYLEGGIFLGTSTYYGDLDTDNLHTSEANFAYGLMLRYNVNDYLTIRGSILGGQLSADDANNTAQMNRERNLSFRSPIAEFSLIPEFNILGYNAYDRLFSPFVYAGVSFFRFNPEAELDGQVYKLQPLFTEGQGLSGRPAPYSLTELAVPLGAGVKFSASEYWNISLEAGYRVTFTDYIDDVSTTYIGRQELIDHSNEIAADLAFRTPEVVPNAEVVPGAMRGNPDQNDAYLFFGVSFTYNFLDGFGGNKYGCPTNF